LNVESSAVDCLISLKFGIEFDYVTSDMRQTIKVKGAEVKVAA